MGSNLFERMSFPHPKPISRLAVVARETLPRLALMSAVISAIHVIHDGTGNDVGLILSPRLADPPRLSLPTFKDGLDHRAAE